MKHQPFQRFLSRESGKPLKRLDLAWISPDPAINRGANENKSFCTYDLRDLIVGNVGGLFGFIRGVGFGLGRLRLFERFQKLPAGLLAHLRGMIQDGQTCLAQVAPQQNQTQ